MSWEKQHDKLYSSESQEGIVVRRGCCIYEVGHLFFMSDETEICSTKSTSSVKEFRKFRLNQPEK